ncbi:MAG: hypothetical protein WCI88_09465 [Chloroflexota bacterium]
MDQKKKTSTNDNVIRVKTNVQAGYWTCSGVSGPVDNKGRVRPAYAASCWK